MSDYQAQLYTTFDFTPADLQANRDGKMTASQQQKIKPSLLNYAQIVGITVIVVLIGSVLGAIDIALNPSPLFGPDLEYVPIAFGIIVFVAMIILIGIFFFERQAIAEARDGKVTSINGRLKIYEIEAVPDTVSKLMVRKEVFQALSNEQLAIVQQIREASDDSEVTIYYTPRTRKFLSIELHES